MDRRESPLTESKKAITLKCTEVMKVNEEEKLQEVVNYILSEVAMTLSLCGC